MLVVFAVQSVDAIDVRQITFHWKLGTFFIPVQYVWVLQFFSKVESKLYYSNGTVILIQCGVTYGAYQVSGTGLKSAWINRNLYYSIILGEGSLTDVEIKM